MHLPKKNTNDIWKSSVYPITCFCEHSLFEYLPTTLSFSYLWCHGVNITEIWKPVSHRTSLCSIWNSPYCSIARLPNENNRSTISKRCFCHPVCYSTEMNVCTGFSVLVEFNRGLVKSIRARWWCTYSTHNKWNRAVYFVSYIKWRNYTRMETSFYVIFSYFGWSRC